MILSFLTRLKKRERIVFFAAIFFVALALLDRLIITPIAAHQRGIEEKIATQLDLTKKNTRIIVEKERIAQAKKEFARYSRKAGTQEEEMAFLLEEVERMARKSSLYIIDMKPLGLQEDALTMKYTVDLNCEAQMAQIIAFMHDVESAALLLKIESFNIAPKSKDSSIATANMRISHVIFLNAPGENRQGH